jgi:phytoene dehydrogenase-like protein
MNDTAPVIIVGAGIAGLTCANYLQGFGIPCTLLEAGDRPGGRARTDLVEGFRLDRGFQIFLTAYPEARRLLDYEALHLKTFRQGAIIRQNGRFSRLPNPLREPLSAPQALFSPVGTLADKLKVVQLTGQLAPLDDDEIFRGPATSTLSYLSGFGWSEKMIRNFFQPFLGGIFLEKELVTSSHFFRFVFQKFYQGDAALPAEGIEAISRQLAARLPAGTVRTGVRAEEVRGRTVHLAGGETLTGRAVVLATDASAAARLLGQPLRTTFNQTTCLYFAADASPLDSPMLVINAEPGGLVNHLAVVSDVAPGYAPNGKSLVSVNLVGQAREAGPEEIAAIRNELAGWFGEAVHGWRHLRTYAIPEALPRFTARQPEEQPLKLAEGLYRCGDYPAYPSYNAAMLTGRHVAEQIAGR